MRKAVKWGAIAAVLVSSVASTSACKKRQKGPALQAEDLAVGAAHACALMKSGVVRCWGKNDAGQLGDGTHQERARPVLLEEPVSKPGTAEIYAAADTTCVTLDEGANVRCWGRAVSDPSALHDVAELAFGANFLCARLKTGAVVCGKGPVTPTPIKGLERTSALAASDHHACAVLKDDGSVRCWGNNESGQLGDGTTEARAEPVSVSGLRGAIQIAAGGAHTCVTLADRTASCWGSNRYGQLGDGTRVDRPIPAPVVHLDAVRAVVLGDGHSCARLYDGTLRCWGQNDKAQQNDGTHEDRTTPGMISGLFDVQQLGLGNGTVCARLADGAVRCWGRNESGQAGDGTRAERPVPVTVRW